MKKTQKRTTQEYTETESYLQEELAPEEQEVLKLIHLAN
jgi:hypothetical protein